MKTIVIGFILIALVLGGLYVVTNGSAPGAISPSAPSQSAPLGPPDSDFKNLKIN